MPHWEEHKKCLWKNAASSRKAEIANAKREINKALSAEQLHIRRDWTARPLKKKLLLSPGTDPEIHGIFPL